jgi:hypothetical protein
LGESCNNLFRTDEDTVVGRILHIIEQFNGKTYRRGQMGKEVNIHNTIPFVYNETHTTTS